MGLVESVYDKMNKDLMNKFTLFIKSPYFNNSSLQVDLHLYLKSNGISSKSSVESLLKNKNLSLSNYKKIMATQLALLKKFFLIENIVLDDNDWLESLTSLDIKNTYLKKEANKFRKKIIVSKTSGKNYSVLNDFRLSEFETYILYNEKRFSSVDVLNSFKHRINLMDEYCVLIKLKQLCYYYNLFSSLNEVPNIAWKDAFEIEMTNSISNYSFLLKLFWKIVLIRKNELDEMIFDDVVSLLKHQEFQLVDYDNRKLIYSHMIGLCIALIVRKNLTKYNITLFDLYNKAIENGYMHELNGYIEQRTYKNIIRCALNNEEFDWVLLNLKNAKKYIISYEFEDSLNYNKAVYFYYLKKYDNALKYFSLVPYDNLYYSLDLRVFMLRIYYETEETELLFFLIDSFRAFLKRNNNYSKTIIQSVRHFINGVKRLASIHQRDKKKLIALREKFEKLNPVVEKKWFLEQINDAIFKIKF